VFGILSLLNNLPDTNSSNLQPAPDNPQVLLSQDRKTALHELRFDFVRSHSRTAMLRAYYCQE